MMESKVPLISIVVPVYNVAPFLCACVDSILGQTYKNLEILLVDDGSEDESGSICESYSEKDSRIQVFHKKNGGQASARNFGLSKAKGEYLAFIDSDDVLSPFFIQTLYDACSKLDAEISYSRIGLFDKAPVLKFFDSPNVDLVEKKIVLERYASSNLKDSIPIISFCNKLIKRSLLQNFQFPEDMVYEDTASIFLLLYQMKRCAFVDCELYFYRKNENSTTIHQYNEKNLDAVKAFQMAISFFKEKSEKEIVQLLFVPLLMHELYCWWGEKNILKNLPKSCDLLRLFRRDVFAYAIESPLDKWSLVFVVFAAFPWFYSLYRKFCPGKIGGR